MIDDITVDVEVKALKGSGFTIVGINSINIHIGKYDPSRGGSYIPLPMWISHKKACINIKNNDDKCFKYCIECA
jgi:hypothetical protein